MKFKYSPQERSGSGDGNLFLRLKDGDSVKVILRGNPSEFFTLWQNGKSSPAPEGTKGASFRFRINAIVTENDKYVVKIWEQGTRVYNALKALSEDYDLNKTVLRVSRSGSSKDDTQYSIVPLPGGVDSQAERAIGSLKLHELEVKSQVEPTPFDQVPTTDFDDEIIPF
jgi:hypothetical protein